MLTSVGASLSTSGGGLCGMRFRKRRCTTAPTIYGQRSTCVCFRSLRCRTWWVRSAFSETCFRGISPKDQRARLCALSTAFMQNPCKIQIGLDGIVQITYFHPREIRTPDLCPHSYNPADKPLRQEAQSASASLCGLPYRQGRDRRAQGRSHLQPSEADGEIGRACVGKACM